MAPSIYFDNIYGNVLSQVLDVYMERNITPSFDFRLADLFEPISLNVNETKKTLLPLNGGDISDNLLSQVMDPCY